MRSPTCSWRLQRVRLFAFLTMAPAVLSVGQCDTNGVCTIKGGMKNGQWWRKELNAASTECDAIKAGSQGTCHQWTVELRTAAKARVHDIKSAVADYILTTEQVELKSRVLTWNDPMDELYLSAPKNTQGSDRVFVTPHIDGFVGWIPFMRAWRCVYGLTGPHDTVTIQPMRNPDEREVTLGPGVFTCFDYNREIHWIENRHVEGKNALDERMVLKLHFYEYPAILETLGHLFGQLNAQYNFFARRAFLVSQFPDQSPLSRLVARGINGITLFGGSAEAVYGYCNAGIVLLVAAGCGGLRQGHRLLAWAGPLYLAAMALALTFRSNTLGMLTRDVSALGATTWLLAAALYGKAQLAQRFNGASAAVVALGAALAAGGYRALGPDLAFLGAELAADCGLAGAAPVAAWPYSAVAHPMALGSLTCLLGLRLHPTFGPKFHGAFLALSLAEVALLAVEVLGVAVPPGHGYDASFADFAAFHRSPGNVFAHLATTGAALAGVLGLAFNAALGRHQAAAGKAGAREKGGANGPCLATAFTWLFVRYTVPDDDVAFATVGLVGLLAAATWAQAPGNMACWILIAGGALAQEASHYAFGETTYMAGYVGEAVAGGGWAGAAATFALHNVWLLPFEIRAAINAATASLVGPAVA